MTIKNKFKTSTAMSAAEIAMSTEKSAMSYPNKVQILSTPKTLCALFVLSALYANHSLAADFYFGQDDDVHLQINSQLSVGASWRLKDADPRFIATTNGGTGATSTTDDGNLNFKQGKTFSKIIKGNHDLQLTKDNIGAFVRVKYWYDKELNDENRAHGNFANSYVPSTPLGDQGFADFTKFSGLEVLDAYVFGQFDLGEMPLDLRLGRQVVSWGESTFIQGGISSINPFDVSAFRRPGAALKEGLLPVGMVYANLGLTENLSLETFYQYEWEKTQIDGCGTLFSGADFAASGCEAVTVIAPDQHALAGGFFAQRQNDIEPDDGGQYGFALRYYAQELNDTEFGLYFLNIHSRLPLINAVRTRVPTATGDPTKVFVPLSLDPTSGALAALNPGYLIEFPEDLKYYGLSFATNVSGIALSGEISYKPDTPIQINGPDIVAATLTEAPSLRFTERLTTVGYGEIARGYDLFDVTQIQVTGLKFFEQVMGASRLTLIGEAAMILTDDIEKSSQHYGRNAVFGTDGTKGFVTDSAWGYRLQAVWNYADVFAGVSLKPTLAWSHDVDGYSPEPAQQFHQGRKSLGLAIEASYQQKYSATLGYKTFNGGSHNVLEDKDFISLSFGFSY